MTWYRLHDSDPTAGGAVAITRAEAQTWNDRGFGIFTTVNEFNGPRRIANLKRIRAWAVDLDAGTKEEQCAVIEASPLVPSWVVETKNGYHVWWFAQDGRAEHWNAIVLDRLVPHYGADRNARDIARILRVPGYLHLKDPADPFQVTTAHRWEVYYTEQQMAAAYESVEREEKELEKFKRETRPHRQVDGDDFWERVYNLDCAEGLSRLSGHHSVGGESYTFSRNASGTQNILVDGKGTSCWVDASGRIGSLSGGGPTLYNWLRWMENSPRDCAQILKELFPQLEVKP